MPENPGYDFLEIFAGKQAVTRAWFGAQYLWIHVEWFTFTIVIDTWMISAYSQDWLHNILHVLYTMGQQSIIQVHAHVGVHHQKAPWDFGQFKAWSWLSYG